MYNWTSEFIICKSTTDNAANAAPVKHDEKNKVSFTCALGLGRKSSKRKLKFEDIKSVTVLLKAVK